MVITSLIMHWGNWVRICHVVLKVVVMLMLVDDCVKIARTKTS